MKRTARSHINDYPEILREQSFLGELPPELQKELEQSAGYAEFLQARELENHHILTKHPPQEMTALIRERALATTRKTPRISQLPRIFFSVMPAAAALLIILFLIQPFQEITGNSAKDVTRIKGNAQDTLNTFNAEAPSLEIWKQTGGSAIPLQSGAQVKAFDSLQIAYRAQGRGYGMIVSLDGNNKLTLHFPDSFNTSTALRPGNAVVLPYAYQLDNAPRFERFFFITSRTEFKVAPVWAQIEHQLGGKNVPPTWAMEAALNLGPGFDACSFLLRK